MSFLEHVVKVFPTARDDLEARCHRLQVEDFPQLEELLSNAAPRVAFHREWRKAVFRLLDCIYLDCICVDIEALPKGASNCVHREAPQVRLSSFMLHFRR